MVLFKLFTSPPSPESRVYTAVTLAQKVTGHLGYSCVNPIIEGGSGERGVRGHDVSRCVRVYVGLSLFMCSFIKNTHAYIKRHHETSVSV